MELIPGDAVKEVDPRVREIARLAGRRAENLYDAHRLCCSESVLLVINQAFGGGLTPEMAVSLGAGFCGGLRGSGCVCGALSGAVMVLSQFLAPHQPGGLKKRRFEEVSRQMHDRFKARFGSTCCRVLTRKVRDNRKAHLENCLGLTGGGAGLAAEILLHYRPELLTRVDMAFLRGRDSRLRGLLSRLRGKVPGAASSP